MIVPWIKTVLTIFVVAVFVSGCGSRSSMQIVDTHIHLYDTSRPEGVPWPLESDTVLYRPVLPPDFAKECEENGISATVIVEASSLLADNQWILDLVKVLSTLHQT
jgi:L-fuconolactonase